MNQISMQCGINPPLYISKKISNMYVSNSTKLEFCFRLLKLAKIGRQVKFNVPRPKQQK